MNATVGGRLRRRLQQRELVGTTRRLPRTPSTSTGTSAPSSSQLLAKLVALRRGAMRANVPPAPPAPRQAVGADTGTGACAGAVLAPAPRARAARPGAAVRGGRSTGRLPSRRARPSTPADGVRLEHGAHGVLRQPEPVLRRTGSALEVGEHSGPSARNPSSTRSATTALSARPRRGTGGPSGPIRAGTRGTRSSGRTTAPCWSPRRSRGVRRARRTRQGS
jgi:hypothetical protein